MDAAIHRAAGVAELLAEGLALGGCTTGDAKATPGFKLPAKWIFHAVGPVWSVARGGKAAEARVDAKLASCYRRCMELAREHAVKSIAFPAISTGVYRFPPDRAARIAVETVRESLPTSDVERVIFCCFNEATEQLYRALLFDPDQDRNVPTILRFGAFRIMVYTDDHEPAHVHVDGRGGLLILYLHAETQTVSIRSASRVSKRDVNAIKRFVTENLDILLAAWEQLHGE